MTFSMLSPTSLTSSPKRKGFRKPSKWNPEMCFAYIWPPHALEVRDRQGFWQWKWNEGGLCPSSGQELGPMPGIGRSFIFSLNTCYMLISTEETSFSFLPPKRRSQCWLRSLDRVNFPTGLAPGQPVVHLCLRGTALTKSLAHFGNPCSLASPKQN